LIEIINRAEVAIKGHNHAKLTAVLDELGSYGKTHFEREELVAKAAGYPEAGQLHESHSKLIADLVKFKDGINGAWNEVASTKFTAFLRDWLIEHVIKEDLLMKPWLVKHSPTFDPRS
jgi:hemerythrin